MRFYKLTHPDYQTDQESDRKNPIEMAWGLTLPAVLCPDCGWWSATFHIRIHMDVPPSSSLRDCSRTDVLSVEEWNAFVQRLRAEGWIPSSARLQPGTEIGMPKAALKSTFMPDIMHPFPGVLIVRGTVVEALQEAGISGFKPTKVELSWDEGVNAPLSELPDLYDLEVHGLAWPVGVDAQSILICQICGRSGNPHKPLVIDEDRWDGSDFVRLEMYNSVYVTERVCQVLSEHHFSNFACESLTG